MENAYSVSSNQKHQPRDSNFRTVDENNDFLTHSPIPSKYN